MQLNVIYNLNLLQDVAQVLETLDNEWSFHLNIIAQYSIIRSFIKPWKKKELLKIKWLFVNIFLLKNEIASQ